MCHSTQLIHLNALLVRRDNDLTELEAVRYTRLRCSKQSLNDVVLLLRYLVHRQNKKLSCCCDSRS